MITLLDSIKNTSVGLDISNSVVRIMVLEKYLNKFRVIGFGKESFSSDSEEDITEAIKRLSVRLNIKKPQVVTNYRGRDIQTVVMESPVLSQEELINRLREEIKKLFSLTVDVSTWCISYHIIQRTEEKYRLAVSFCKPESINKLIGSIEKAGLKPVMIGAQILDLYLGFSLDFDDLFEENYGFVNQDEVGIEYCLTEKGNPVLMDSINSLEMISKKIEEWQSYNSTKISKILFTGQELKKKDIDKVGIKEAVKKIGYPLRCCIGGKINPEYAVASGLAVKRYFPQLNTIDLLPETKKVELSKEREKNKAQKIIITAGSLLLVVIFLLQGFKFFFSKKLSELQQQKMILRKSIVEVEKAEREQQELMQIYYHIQKLSRKKSNYSELLYQISQKIPKLVWLHEFMAEQGNPENEMKDGIEKNEVVIRGLTFNEVRTAEFLENLENLTLLNKVRLSGTNRLSAGEVWRRTKIRRIPLIQFTIKAELNQ